MSGQFTIPRLAHESISVGIACKENENIGMLVLVLRLSVDVTSTYRENTAPLKIAISTTPMEPNNATVKSPYQSVGVRYLPPTV